jgi:hypothetical protein
MFGIGKGNKSQPRTNQGNNAHETSAIKKRGLEIDKQGSSLEQIHVKVGRVKLTLLHDIKGLRQF